MIPGRLKADKVRSGEDLRSALCTACDCMAPQRFDNVMLNKLLDFSELPRDDPRRDPLELKQALAAIDPTLGTLKLKQRKAMMNALEEQLRMAARHDAPNRFFVEGGWPPKEPEPEPPRGKPSPTNQIMISPTPLSGEGEGFTWTQTENEVSITVCVPEGTQKQEVLMQLTPKFGPAQQLVVRARFWPLPLVAGMLHFPVDASEAVWHLDSGSRVTIDLPKIEDKLWPGTPAVFISGPGPLAEYTIPSLPSDDSATGAEASSRALVVGVAPESVVQKMGQKPNDLETQLQGCQVLSTLIETDPGKALGAANARAITVLLRILRVFGHKTEVQLTAWRPLLQMVSAQPFLRKLLLDAGGMRLILSGLDACKSDEVVLTQLCLGCRTMLPSTPPRPFVESGGLELLVESVTAHPKCAPLAEVAGSCLHMLSAVNNIVRRMILRMEVVTCMLELCDSLPERLPLHEVTLGLIVQLSKGDLSCSQLFAMQVSTARLLGLMARFPDEADVQADGARALASLVSSERAVLTFVAEDGLPQLLKVAESHGEGSTVENEVINVLEQAVCAMCEAIDDEAPEDELDAAGMVELLNQMVADAHERVRLAAEAKRKAEDEAREAAEAAEVLRRAAEAEEKARVAEIESIPTQYSGFNWGSSFDDPRLADLDDDAPDAPRIVELDDD